MRVQDLKPGTAIRAIASVPGLFVAGDEFLVHDDLSIDCNDGVRTPLPMIADAAGNVPFERSGYETPAPFRFDLVALAVALLALFVSVVGVLT